MLEETPGLLSCFLTTLSREQESWGGGGWGNAQGEILTVLLSSQHNFGQRRRQQNS